DSLEPTLQLPQVMSHFRSIVAATLFFLLFICISAWGQKAAHLQQVTEAIAKGSHSTERRRAITGYVEAEGIAFRLDDFIDVRMRKGTNIIVSIPGKTTETLLLGAHYDRAVQGQGAIDNGASCAVLLDLINTFKSKPLSSYTLQVIFFDLEEVGLRG